MSDQITPCPGPKEGDPDVDGTINAAIMSDLEWHLNPAHPHTFCGGCGIDAVDCHPGLCCSEERDRLRMLESVCGYCRTRYETGQILHQQRMDVLG